MPIVVSQEIEVPKQKPGRNDPCYCGSGKKYKKCHLLEDRAQEQLLYSKGDIAHKLSAWLVGQEWFTDLVVKKMKQYFPVAPKEISEMELTCFSEALAYEGKSKGKLPIVRFIEEAPLDTAEKELYKQWVVKSRFSFFLVLDVKLGQSLTVRDLTDGVEYTVMERAATYEVKKGDALFSRIVPLPEGRWMFTGAYSSLYSGAETDFVKELRQRSKGLDRLNQLEYIIIQLGGNTSGDIEGLGKLSREEIRSQLRSRLEDLGCPLTVERIDQSLTDRLILPEVFLEQITSLRVKKGEAEEILSLFCQYWNSGLPLDDGEFKAGTKEKKLIGQMLKELARRIDPNAGDVSEAYEQGVLALKNKEYAKALALMAPMAEFTKNKPEAAPWYFNVGACLMELGEIDLGLKYFKRCQRLKPDHKQAAGSIQFLDDKRNRLISEAIGKDNALLAICAEPWVLKDDIATSKNALLADAVAFFDYIQSQTPPISAKRREIRISDCQAINQTFQQPNPSEIIIGSNTHKIRDEYDLAKVYFLHILFLAARWIRSTGKSLAITKKGLALRQGKPEVFLGEIFRAWLEALDWQDLEYQGPSWGPSFMIAQYADIQDRLGEIIYCLRDRQKGTFTPGEIIHELEETNRLISERTNPLDLAAAKNSPLEALAELQIQFRLTPFNRSFMNIMEWAEVIKPKARLFGKEKYSLLPSPNKQYYITDFGRLWLDDVNSRLAGLVPAEIRKI